MYITPKSSMLLKSCHNSNSSIMSIATRVITLHARAAGAYTDKKARRYHESVPQKLSFSPKFVKKIAIFTKI